MPRHSNVFRADQPYDRLPLLPPQQSLLDTVPILRKEAEARQTLAELKGIANIIPNQSILINAIGLREAKDSSAIENIMTTNDRLYRAIAANATAGTDAATKEVVSYREALEMGVNLIRKNRFLSVNQMQEIQALIVGNNAGIRRTPGTALVNDQTGETVYTPPQDPDRLNQLLSNFADHFNGAANTLADMAVLHYQFESIHPFADGNGRTGRVLNVLFLLLRGFLDLPILYPSAFIIANKNEYYGLLREVTAKNRWDVWVMFMLEAIQVTSQSTIEQVRRIRDGLEDTIDKVRAAAPRIYSKELVETLFVHPYCKIEFIVKSLGVERKAASRYLKELSALGVLQGKKVGRENIYVNTNLMEILSRA